MNPIERSMRVMESGMSVVCMGVSGSERGLREQ